MHATRPYDNTDLLLEDGLSLATETGLLPVVAALALGVERGLASLVLGHLVQGVLAALLARAEGLARLRDVHLQVQVNTRVT